MKEKIQAVKRFLRCFIGDTIWVLLYYGKLKRELEKCSISHISIYKFHRWHSGFNYFTGIYKNKKVFIKACCDKWNTIPAEGYLSNYKTFNCHPRIINYKLSPFSWIATDFRKLTPIDHLDKSFNRKGIINDLVYALDKMYKYGIIHRDLRPENICVDNRGRVVLIDFGWAIYRDKKWKKTPYKFIEKILNQEFRDKQNKYDDAISMILSLKKAFPGISDEELAPIYARIGRLKA